ncbi:MAG TPA: ribosome biogenesis GTPase Der [Oligoflexia bacterium]|nr:ribosome biogenesis GTPase Der [Oligoflexia bacterium]
MNLVKTAFSPKKGGEIPPYKTTEKPYSIAIVGRPNVGKSTLFNRIIKSRRSIVHDQPGITRDVIMETINLAGRTVQLMDTGGLSSFSKRPKDAMLARVFEKALHFIKQSDLVLFVVDGIVGLTEEDRAVAKDLRKLDIPIILLVNKVDPGAAHRQESDFYALGFKDYFPVAAEHNYGVANVLEEIESQLKLTQNKQDDSQPTNKQAMTSIRVALLGRPNVGKSTLFNRMLGEDRSIVSDVAGTTRDSINSDFIKNDIHWTFVDTAGIRKTSKLKQDNIEFYSVNRAKKAVDASDVIILMLNAEDNITTQDQKIAAYIMEQRKALLILANKWDQQPKGDSLRSGFREELYYRAPFLRFAEVKFISAKEGLGTRNLLSGIKALYDKLNSRFTEDELKDAYKAIIAANPPKGAKAHILEFRRLSYRPNPAPTFFIRCNKRRYVPDALKKFWKNSLYHMFDLQGIPIKLVFHEHMLESDSEREKE